VLNTVIDANVWVQSPCPIYGAVFYKCVARLGSLHAPTALEQLKKVENFLKGESHFDAHLAESIIEAEDMHTKHR
jgi:hypothetical protein